MHLQTIVHSVAFFGIENAAAPVSGQPRKIHSKARFGLQDESVQGIARGSLPLKASAAQAVAAFFTRLFYHRQKALSSTFYAFCGKNMNQLLQSHFVRQLPQGGSLWQYGQLFGCARASLNEKDFPRPGEDVTQVTKRGAVASRSDDGRSYSAAALPYSL